MALFRGQDENLPILTQLYQLEYDPFTGEGDLPPFLASYLPRMAFGSAQVATLPDDANERASILRRIGSFVALLRRLMGAIADSRAADVEDITALNRLLEERVKPAIECAYDGLDADTQTFRAQWCVMRQGGLRVYQDVKHADQWHKLIETLAVTSLVEAIDRGALTRCPRCGNVFPKAPGKQLYCSDRCNNRTAVSRHRAKINKSKKEGIAPG